MGRPPGEPMSDEPDTPPASAARGHMLQQVLFELSTGDHARVQTALGPGGAPLIRILDRPPPEASSSAPSSDLAEVLKSESSRLILDLSQCEYLSSADLGLVARLAGVQKDSGGRLYVVGASRHALKMMRLVGLDQAFETCTTLDELPPDASDSPDRDATP